MQKIIILNGPAGVGKTTIGNLLANTSENSVCISGDELNKFIINKTESVKGRLGYKNGAALIDNFAEAGYELIIFEYVFPSQEHIDYLKSQLKTKITPNCFTLWASLEVIVQREANRKNRERLGDLVKECYSELKMSLVEFENVIETENLTKTEVLNIILNESTR